MLSIPLSFDCCSAAVPPWHTERWLQALEKGCHTEYSFLLESVDPLPVKCSIGDVGSVRTSSADHEHWQRTYDMKYSSPLIPWKTALLKTPNSCSKTVDGEEAYQQINTSELPHTCRSVL
ncbi:unnamed protein product [Dicrocoelium dendriticum]|nr:unnamed protein product [Dicrocoelium dendriticum]